MRKLKKRLPVKKALKGRKQKSPPTQSEFDDVAVYFSHEEWGSLEEDQKDLYQQVMMDNYQTFHTLGPHNKKTKLIACLERGKDPSITRRGRPPKTPDISNKQTKELNTSLFTPDGMTVEGVYLMDDLEEDPCISLKEDNVTTKRQYNFRDRVRVEYSAFFDDEVKKLKRKKRLRVKFSYDKLEPGISSLYSCSECDKKYKQKSNLIKHQKLHTDVSRFICLKCDK
ncbi:zinc finger protein 565-like [Anomaloglossus baeobatrachus]|uniref:zinc finger protein 565-like n=1 Tax=Anomaloglossus baeobatrachus TaxID=238106 RepID=UPI003F4FC808